MVGLSGLMWLVPWGAALLATTLGMAWWSARVWRRRAQLSTASKVVASVGVLAAVWGVGGTLLGVLSGLGAVFGDDGDPSQRARFLAEGISQAVSCTIFGALSSAASVIVGLLLATRAGSRASS
jgi:uncharacterized membrane protein